MRFRLLFTVYAVALACLAWLLLPGFLRGLATIPAFALWFIWVTTRPHRTGPHRGAHELDRGQADEADEDWTAELVDDQADAPDWLPDEHADPIGHYSTLARRYVRDSPWQQRGPDEGPRVIGPPTHDFEIVGRLPDPTVGPREYVEPPPELQPMPGPVPELDHDDQAAEPGDPPAELDDEAAIWPDPLDQWAEAAKEHIRATIDLARRMIL